MIKWLKDLFNKSKVEVKKERELTNEEKQILSRLERNRDYSILHSIRVVYLIDGTPVEILGNWSYPDVDITKRGTVCRGVEDGRIYEFQFRFALLFERKPHTWVKSLTFSDQEMYLNLMYRYSDKELEDEFLTKISKQELRDQKLKELGIE